MSPRTPVSDALVKEFAERGFVIVPELLTAAEITLFGNSVDRAVHSRMSSDTRSLDQKTRYEQSFQQCLNLWEDFPEVRPLSFHPRLAATAARLLGVERVRIWHDQALYKEAGGQSTAAHQDQPYWPIQETDTVTAWIPFEDVTPANGGMGYVPGSHRFGVRKFANIFTGDGFDLAHGAEARGVAVYFPERVPAGCVAFHHGLTLHTARPNPSERTRRVHTVIYFADGSHRARNEFPHPCVDRPGIRPGERIASDHTPIAWPRPATDLPVPPPLPNPLRRGWPGWPPRTEASS